MTLVKNLSNSPTGKAKAPAPSASAPALGKKQSSGSAGKAKAPAPVVALGREKSSSSTAGKAKAPAASAPVPALGRKGGKAALHAPVPAPAGHAGQTKGKAAAHVPVPAPAGQGKGKKEDAKKAGKHALAPAPGDPISSYLLYGCGPQSICTPAGACVRAVCFLNWLGGHTLVWVPLKDLNMRKGHDASSC